MLRTPWIVIAVAAIALVEPALSDPAQGVIDQDDVGGVPTMDRPALIAEHRGATPIITGDRSRLGYEAILGSRTSLTPEVTMRHGSPRQHRRMEQALARFRTAGLPLPDLEIVFHSDEADCGGHLGLFRPRQQTPQIRICSELGFVYEHELAHAWEHANLADEIRYRFMEIRGLFVWDDPTVPWSQRGVEGVAVVVQQGLAGLPLPPILSTGQLSRLTAFSFLTGGSAPRLLEWCAGSESDGKNDRAQINCPEKVISR